MQRISSKDNSLIKHIKRLKEKKYRDEYGEYAVEGLKLIKEAIQENADIRHIVVCDGCDNSEMIESHLKYEMARLDFIYVPQNIFKLLSDVENPQGVLAVISKPNKESDINLNEDIILALDDIQDPGNLGTIIRSAVAFNVDTIIMSNNTVDLYNEKTIRASEGMIFNINILKEELISFINNLKKKDYKIFGTNVNGGKLVNNLELPKKYAIIVGNEGSGVKKEILDMCDEHFYVPMNLKCESLNVGVATSIILYEIDKYN